MNEFYDEFVLKCGEQQLTYMAFEDDFRPLLCLFG